MQRSRLDRAFARYARTGDSEALARVFDGCAGELYRIGFHLLGDRHAAEDLVQQTFVVAIEQAARFDRSRRVLPWLCGILTHRALHTRRQVRAGASAVARGIARDDIVDPVAHSAANEVADRVAATVRALPEPYRQVLLLHLVHELTPQEVAEALARPDATVRTQLARGLERLRKLLPVGVAGHALGQVPAPVGLAAVRAAVLARAGEALPAAAAGAVAQGLVFSGVMMMKKTVLVATVLVAVLSTWLWLRADPVLPPAPDAPSSVAANVAPQRTPMAATPSTPAANEARVAAPEPVDPHAAGLEVRVLWPDGTPAADIPVRVRPRPLDFEVWLRVARTGDDGAVRFVGLPPGEANALTGRGANADVDLVAGGVHRTTITLGKGVDVHGRVVDLDERPIAGATVWMSVASFTDDSEPVAVTGSDGAFSIRDAGASFTISASAPGFGCAKVLWVGDPQTVLTLRPAPGVVVGLVVDAEGRPVAGARVLLGTTLSNGGKHGRVAGQISGQDLWPSRFLRTDDDGRFRCEGMPAIRWPLWVGAPGFAAAWREVEVRADAPTEVTVRLTQGGTVRGRITDASGVPQAGVVVDLWPDLPAPHVLVGLGIKQLAGPPLWARASVATDADGRYEMRRVLAGKHMMQAWAAAARAVARTEGAIVDGETFVWDGVVMPEVDPSHSSMHGVLVGEDGAVLRNWEMRVGDPKNASNFEAPHNAFFVHDDGAFRTNPLPPGRYPLFVAPRAPMFGPEVALGDFDVASSPLRVVVPRAHVPVARVRGRVVWPADAGAARCHVYVEPTANPGALRVACDDQGRFEAGPVLNGRYRLRAESAAFGTIVLRTIEVAEGRDVDLGACAVPTAGTLVVRIVDAAGERRPDAWVLVDPVGDDARGGTLEHRDGVAQGQLLPGRWRVTSRDPATMAVIEVDVRAGAATEARLVIPDGVSFVLRVPDQAREEHRWRLQWRDASAALLRESTVWHHDAGKELTLRAVAGHYVLEVVDGRGAKAKTAFDLRASEQPLIVEMPLPAK